MKAIQNMLPVVAAVVTLLAAGGTARAAEKETPIDWPARAATVKVGMTRAEVEKILPRWKPLPSNRGSRGDGGATITGPGYSRTERYLVAEDWCVVVSYDFAGGETIVSPPGRKHPYPWTVDQRIGYPRDDANWCNPQNRLLEPVKIEKVKELAPPKSTP